MANENVNSICRVLDILECFTDKRSSWGIIELAQKLGLPASTVHRLMNTLVSRGYLAQDPHSKRYKPGSRLIWFSEAVISQYDSRNIARPFLQELAKLADETVHLCQLDHFDLFYVDKIETSHSVNCNSYMGLRIPAHASSAGKAMLAYQDETTIQTYLDQLDRSPVFTKNTISDPEALLAELSQVKSQGYALDNEEIELGLTCVAAPIFDMNRSVQMALSISGPTFRMQGSLEQFIPLVKNTAQKVSDMLGYRN